MQRQLVHRAQAGDHDAFSVLVRGSYPRLFGVARLILRDLDRAQDAVQEALVLAWRDIRALRDADAWDAWLKRLTVRACYKSARKACAVCGEGINYDRDVSGAEGQILCQSCAAPDARYYQPL